MASRNQNRKFEIYKVMFTLFFCVICLASQIKGYIISLANLDSITSKICWGEKSNYLDEYDLSRVLHCYDSCLKALQRDSKPNTQLYNTLVNNIVCILPTVNSKYYSGNIGYSTVSEANKLLEYVQNNNKSLSIEDIKKNCKTARGVRSAENNKIAPLTIPKDKSEREKACEQLSRLHHGNEIEKIVIATPQLDDNKNPTSIKVPTPSTGGDSSFPIDNPEAGNALTRYYTIVMKCLTFKNKHKHMMMVFNKDFYKWLTEAVMPHLGDNKIYPAFGGVLRILETMKENDYIPDSEIKSGEGDRIYNLDDGSKIISSKYFPLVLLPWSVILLLLIVFLVWKSAIVSKCWREYKDDTSSDSDTAILFYPEEEPTVISIELKDEEDGSVLTSLSSSKNDLRDYNALTVTASPMGVPKKKKHRQGLRKKSSSSSDR